MDKEECTARVSGKFRYNVSAISEFPSVGDFVLVEYSFKDDVVVIHKVLPRKSIFIRKAAGKKCRFHNCTHTSEPGCAVRAAMEDGIIDEERLKSYKKLKAENSYMEDTGNYMLAKKKKFKEIAKYNKNNLKR